MAIFIFRGAVARLFDDGLENPTFARNGGIESAREEFYALGEDLNDTEAFVIHCPLNHLVHMIDLGRVSAGDKGRASGDELLDRVNRTVNGSDRVGF